MKNSRILIFFLLLVPFFVLANDSFLVRSIKIKGEYPLFKKDILEVMTIMVGDAVDSIILAKQRSNIVAGLEKYGFKVRAVDIKPVYDLKYECIDLVIEIDKGNRIKMRRIDFEGNESFTNFRLSFRYRVWDYKVFPIMIGRGYKRDDINNNLLQLQKFYWNSKYPECRISQSLLLDSLKYRTDLVVSIDEGPKYKFDYSNIRPYRRKEIKQFFDFSQRGNRNGLAVRRSLKSINDDLKMRGYIDGVVRLKDTLLTYKRKTIKTIIPIVDAKQRIVINDIRYLGVRDIHLKQVKSQVLSSSKGINRKGRGALNEEVLKADVSAIISFYESIGFLRVKASCEIVMTPDGLGCNIIIKVVESEPCRISSVKLTGLDSSDYDSPKFLYKGSSYQVDNLSKELSSIHYKISNDGFSEVKIDSRLAYSSDSITMEIVLEVDKGVMKEIGNINFIGNFRTKDNYLLRETELKRGGLFIRPNLSEAMSTLRNTNLFNRAYYQLVDDDSLARVQNINIYLSEKPALLLSGAIGYETESGVYTRFKTSNKNLFGFNKELELDGIFSVKERRLGLMFLEPTFFLKRSSAWVQLYGKTEDLVAKTVVSKTFGNSYGIKKEFLKNSSFSISAAYELKANDSSINIARHIISVKPELILDGRDSFIRPKKGLYFAAYSSFNSGLNNSNTDDFIKVGGELRGYRTLFRPLTLATRIHGDFIYPYGVNGSVAIDQLITLGGSSTVRGYDEDQLFMSSQKPQSGFIAMCGNIDARIEIMKVLEALLFFDIGSISASASLKNIQNPKYSVGFGLSFLTPIGPIGFAYGIKMKRETGESPGQLHFSIGYRF